jgi:hypothetical protein
MNKSDKQLVDEAVESLAQATEVLGYIKAKYPEVLQEALDNTEK